MTNNDATRTPETLTDLSSAHLAVLAVREMGEAAANIADTQKRENAFTSLHYLISLSQVSANVRTRMRATAGEWARRADSMH